MPVNCALLIPCISVPSEYFSYHLSETICFSNRYFLFRFVIKSLVTNLKNKLLFDWNFNKVNISNNVSVLQADYKDIEVKINKDCNILINYSGYNNDNALVILYKNETPIAKAGGSFSLDNNISLCSITKVSKGDRIKMESHRINTKYPELVNFTICEI